MRVSIVSRIGGIWRQGHSELFCMALGCQTFYNAENPHSIVLARPAEFAEVNAVVPKELQIRFSVEVVDLAQSSEAKSIVEEFIDVENLNPR